MTESTKALQSLKKAANYSKLTMGELGPRSYKKGQGALIKVIDKFGEKGTIDKKRLERELGWRSGEVRKVAEKAEKNGYVSIDDSGFEFTVSLTDKGSEVLQKRFAVEDNAADAVFAGLTAKEKDTLIALCDKVSATCEGLGIDYSRIEKKHRHDCAKKHEGSKQCCKHHDKDHGCHGHHGPKYVFVFGEEGHHHDCSCKRHGKKHGRD